MRRTLVPLLALFAALAAGCGGGDRADLRMVAYEGYAEDGTSDPRVDWVTPFERASGCSVRVDTASTSAEIVDRVTRGGYDVASVSGDVARILIAGQEVVPLELARVPRYRDVYPALRALEAPRRDGRVYGVPHGRFAYVVVARSDIKPEPKYALYDSPTLIADTAIELGYARPFDLEPIQLRRAVRRAALIRSYATTIWRDEVHAVADLTGGTSQSGFVPPRIVALLRADEVPIEVVGTGTTARADTWMITRRARDEDCAYRWLDWILSPRINAQAAEHLAAAPATPRACAHMDCAAVHAGDERHWARFAFWTTPKNWREWFEAWGLIRS